MKNVVLSLVFGILSFNLYANTYYLTGNEAKNLFKTLSDSGVETVILQNGDVNTLRKSNIVCRASHNYRFGGAFLSKPECYVRKQVNTGWNFDQKLEETVALWDRLSQLDHIEADGAAGSFYLTARQVDCSYREQTFEFSCCYDSNY